MGSISILVTDLQSLASETRRKHPEVRDAAEKSLALLRTVSANGAVRLNFAPDAPETDELLRPIFLGIPTRNPKVIAISLSALQKLIALRAVPPKAVPAIVTTMNDCLAQGVDIQLKMLQALVSLVTGFEDIHGALLGDALLLCFRLQDSKIAVVSSTASATLRQLVMFIFDKVVEEDKRNLDVQRKDVQLPDGTKASLRPAALDAFSIFEDLCLLTNGERPSFLKLDVLPKTFALELIESVLTNYHILLRQHPEVLTLLHHHLCPLLLKALSERPFFPFTLRSTRVVFILLKQFSTELITEAEVFLMLLIKIVAGDEPSSMKLTWMRILASEVIRGLCSDAQLMQSFWEHYDAQSSGSNVCASLVSSLKRVATEKPALLGVGHQIQGLNVETNTLDPVSVAGMVASAASSTVSGALGIGSQEAGLSLATSAMRVQCIDQLDKAEPPPIPDTYLFLLVLQSLVSLSDGFGSTVLPIYSSLMLRKANSTDGSVKAPPALDCASLPQDNKDAKKLLTVRDMIENAWPAMLAAFSFLIATNLSEDLFGEILTGLQGLTNVAGVLGLTTPRDAFLTSISKFAIPTRVVSKLESWVDQAGPRSAGGVLSVDNLAALAGATPAQPPMLSDRNIACLKVLIACSLFLAGSLGQSWYNVLEALQNADYVLTAKGTRGSLSMSRRPSAAVSSATATSATSTTAAKSPFMADFDPDQVLTAIQKVFETSKNLEDDAFTHFVVSLCRLSSEMIGMQAGVETVDNVIPEESSPTAEKQPQLHRRRVSGIQLTRTPRKGDFGLSKLGIVSLLNINRLILTKPEVGWTSITTHLVNVLRHPLAPPSIRAQSAHVLDEILLVVPKNIPVGSDLQATVQTRVLETLAGQVMLEGGSSVVIDLRKSGLETLHQILQSGAHTFVAGWEIVFDMLSSACKSSVPPSSAAPTIYSHPSESQSTFSSAPSTPRAKPAQLSLSLQPTERPNVHLVRVAFQSLTLVCDNLGALSPSQLKLCITTLGLFGRQLDTNIALTAAESLLWSVSDSIQLKRKSEEAESVYSELWMFLLLEMLGLCTDVRPEVRGGAIQTLFRTLQLYGTALSLTTWAEVIWKITFPLVESLTASIRSTTELSSPTDSQTGVISPSLKAWDDSKTLALQSLAGIFNDFLAIKLILLEDFGDIWDKFLEYVVDAFARDNKGVSTAALRCLEKALKALVTASTDKQPTVLEASEKAWKSWDNMGSILSQHTTNYNNKDSNIGPLEGSSFSQDSFMAFVDSLKSIRRVSKSIIKREWDIERLRRMAAILKSVMTYPYSQDYRPDVDALMPVQANVLEVLKDVHLSVSGAPSLILSDLADYATLAFIAAFDLETPAPGSEGKKKNVRRVSYIALSKFCMIKLSELYEKFKELKIIYADGTVEAILGAYSIPIKLKYDCPQSSKHGSDPPLYRIAATNCLAVLHSCCPRIATLGDDADDDHIGILWRQILEVYRGGLLADSSVTTEWALELQDTEEQFDMAFITSLQQDVLPHLGYSRVSDSMIQEFGKLLQNASRVSQSHFDQRVTSSQNGVGRPINGRVEGVSNNLKEFQPADHAAVNGTTIEAVALPRERFSYWCFDLFFIVCSCKQENKQEVRRVASLCLPFLLDRCHTILSNFVEDNELVGDLPFTRVREEELVYVLQQLLELRVWQNSLQSPDSSSESEFQQSLRSSQKAHLFYFYKLLVRIVSNTKPSPKSWVPAIAGLQAPVVEDGHAPVQELNARQLAEACLNALADELRFEFKR